MRRHVDTIDGAQQRIDQFDARSGNRLAHGGVFDSVSGLIAEVRAYYAADEHRGQAAHELGGYDYAKRGYPTVSPRRSSAPVA